MSDFEVFIFGCVNFVVLIAGLIWGLRRTAGQFFYARREGIKRQMVSSAKLLREARVRAASSRAQAARLGEDIVHRAGLIASSCGKECEQIAVEAKRRATWLIDGSGRQAEEEHRKAIADVRRRMLAEAFVRAEGLLKKSVAGEMGKKIVKRGIEELSPLVAAKQGASAGKAEAR